MFTKARAIKQKSTCCLPKINSWLFCKNDLWSKNCLRKTTLFYTTLEHLAPLVLAQNDVLGKFTLNSNCLKRLNNGLKTNRSISWVYTKCALIVVISILKTKILWKKELINNSTSFSVRIQRYASNVSCRLSRISIRPRVAYLALVMLVSHGQVCVIGYI